MGCRPQKLSDMTIEVMGIEVTVKGATYHPHVPATRIDPPETEFVALDDASIFVGDQDITELFRYPYNADKLQDALLRATE